MIFGQILSKLALNKRHIVLLIFSVAAAFLLWSSFFKPVAQDEGVFLAISKGIFEGGVPYLDFFDHKPPGIYYLFSFFLVVFGKNIIVLKILLLITNLFSTYLVFKISEKFAPESGWFSALIFLISLIFFEGNYLIAEPFLVFFLLLGVWCLILYEDSKNVRAIIASGLLFGLACLFKQTAALSLFGVLFYFYLKKYQWREVIAFLTPVFLAGILTFLVLFPVMKEALKQIVILNFTSYPKEDFLVVLKSLLPVFLRTWFLWLPLASYFFLKREAFKKHLLILLILIFPIVSFFVRGYPHYWIQVLPFAAILSGFVLSSFFIGKKNLLHLAFLVLLGVSLYQNLAWFDWIRVNVNAPKLKEEKEVAQYLTSLPNAYLLAENQFTSFYFFSDKRPLSKYLYLTEITDAEKGRVKMLNSLIEHKDTIILWPSDQNFAYAKDIQEYVFKNYKEDREFKSLGLKIYLPNEQ